MCCCLIPINVFHFIFFMYLGRSRYKIILQYFIWYIKYDIKYIVIKLISVLPLQHRSLNVYYLYILQIIKLLYSEYLFFNLLLCLPSSEWTVQLNIWAKHFGKWQCSTKQCRKMSLPSPLRQRKLTWIVEIGDVPPYRSGPYEKHLNFSKSKYLCTYYLSS